MTAETPIATSSAILIVDDDPDIGVSLKDLLEGEGHKVEVVGTGAEALEHVQQKHFDAVLLDVGLPDKDGLTVLGEIVQSKPQLSIVILSAYTSLEKTVGPLDLQGAFAYLKKPYDREEIKSTIRKAVGLSTLAYQADRTQRALSGSENRLRSVVQSCSDAIILSNRDGRIIGWNRAAETQFGYHEYEVIGKPLTLLMPHQYREAHQRGIERIRATGESRVLGKTLELHGLRKTGEQFPIELSLSRSEENDDLFYCGIIRDITERKKSERLLIERNRMLALETEVGQVLSQDQKLPALLQGCAEALVHHLDATFARIWTLNSAEQMLELQASAGRYTHVDGSHSRVPVGQLKIGQIAAEKKPLLTNAVIGDPQVTNQEWAKKEGLVAFAGYPLLRNEEVVGVMALFSRNPLTEFTLKNLGMVAHRITTEIERQIATKAHQNLTELNERILASAGEGIFGVNLDGGITFANPAGARLLGYTVEELTGMQLEVVTHPSRTAESSSLHGEHPVHAALKDGVVHHGEDEVLWRKDGRSVPAEYTSTPIWEDEGLVGAVVIFQDITERKLAQDAHHKVCEQMEKTLTSLPGSIFVVEKNQRVVYANAEAYQHFQQRGSNMIGKLISEVLPFTLDQWKTMADKFTRESNQNLKWQYQELDLGSPDRTYRYCLFPILFDDIETAQIGLIVWDVSEQKKLQDQLIQSEKLSSLGTLVAGMVHEVRSPMQAILGMSDLILEEEKPESIKEMAGDIKRVSRHITTVLSDFMTYARPSSGEKVMDLDLNERLREALKMVMRGPHFGAVEVEQQLNPIPSLSMRQGEMDQVFINLMANAVQAMKGKGRLTLATQCQDDQVTIHISDTGCGMAKEVLNKIFEPFFSTKGKGKGTGLGLSIVQQIVIRNGGDISVDSIEGQGTTFTLRFPVHISSN